MLNIIKELLTELYDYEGQLVDVARQNGYKIIRPSTVLFLLVMLLYVISPYDLVSEAIVKPRAMGFIDDLIVIVLVSGYSYADIKGVLEVNEQDEIQSEDVNVSKESTGKNKVSSADEPANERTNNVDTSTSSSIGDQQVNRQSFSGSISDLDNDLDSIDDDYKSNDAGSGEAYESGPPPRKW